MFDWLDAKRLNRHALRNILEKVHLSIAAFTQIMRTTCRVLSHMFVLIELGVQCSELNGAEKVNI